MENKIKILAPSSSPHICYVSKECGSKIHDLKKETGMTFYAILWECAGKPLKTQEEIKQFKEEVREKGYRNIGEWAESLIDYLHDHIGEINTLDFTQINLKKEDKTDV